MKRRSALVEQPEEATPAAPVKTPAKHKNPQYLKKLANQFLQNRIAPSRGWKNMYVHDVDDASTCWAGHLKSSLARRRECETNDLCKWDFHIEYGNEETKSLGIALDRRTGEVIEVYIGREGAAPPHDF